MQMVTLECCKRKRGGEGEERESKTEKKKCSQRGLFCLLLIKPSEQEQEEALIDCRGLIAVYEGTAAAQFAVRSPVSVLRFAVKPRTGARIRTSLTCAVLQ